MWTTPGSATATLGEYIVTGRTPAGKRVTECVEAASADAAVERLKQRGYTEIVTHTDDVGALYSQQKKIANDDLAPGALRLLFALRAGFCAGPTIAAENEKPSLSLPEVGELPLERRVESQHDIVFRDARFDQSIGDAIFRAVVLDPNFAAANIDVQNAAVNATLPVPADAHQFKVVVHRITDNLDFNLAERWFVLAVFVHQPLNLFTIKGDGIRRYSIHCVTAFFSGSNTIRRISLRCCTANAKGIANEDVKVSSGTAR